jgi:ATP-binding cassette subfamily G (WHITE) protein 2
MDMIAMRKSTGGLSGALLVNGAAPGRGFIRMCAYVPQYDNFVPVMTTREVMQFYAGIILPREWGAQRRGARVEEVLQEMGLAHAAGTLVGGESPGGLMLRGLSGGERKRLSIAAGIIAAPSVVFLDEPTTGLDSFAALTVRRWLVGVG